MNLLKNWKLWVLIALIILSTVGYYVLYGQKTVHGNVNINKIESIDKVYSYNVYSDFYYRVEKYDEDGKAVTASYSKLIPLKTSIGYDFANDPKYPKITLQTTKAKGTLYLDETDGRKIERYIKTFSDYGEMFGTIVATQDQAYFDKSAQKVEKILKNLYGDSLKLPVQDIKKYYTYEDVPISNMKIKYYKLEAINKNLKLKNVLDVKEWQPNIAEWQFGENDRIYLQYLKQNTVGDLYDYLKNDKKKKDALVVKTVKIHNGKLDKIYFKIKLKENKIECLFMDDNGHIYSLIMRTENTNALHKYIPDFLKIVYGINFVDVKNFDNWFAKEQEEKETYFNDIAVKTKEINSLIDRLKNSDIECSNSKYSRIDEKPWDKKFKIFKEMYGHYPDKKMLDELNQVATDLKNKVQDSEGIIAKGSEYYDSGKEYTNEMLQGTNDKISKAAKSASNSASNAVSNVVSFMGYGEDDPIEQKEEIPSVDKNSTEAGFSFGDMWKDMKDAVAEVDSQNTQNDVIELEDNATKSSKGGSH